MSHQDKDRRGLGSRAKGSRSKSRPVPIRRSGTLATGKRPKQKRTQRQAASLSKRRRQLDARKQNNKPSYKSQYLQQALGWLLSAVNFSQLCFRRDCTWKPLQLAAAALLWAWSDEADLGERFFAARRLSQHLFQPTRQFAGSVQAFLKMLVRWTPAFVACLQVAFREQMRTALAADWLVHGFVLFGVDGSRFELPRTLSNEAAYSPPPKPRKGKKRKPRKNPHDAAHTKKATVPQMWLTLLWHVGTGLPWAWRNGSSDSSERGHWREMLGELPKDALIVGDAGFIGYDILRAVLESGRAVVVRVGSNVHLLSKLGWSKQVGSTVYLWPDHAARKGQPPLVLRLVVSQQGKHPVYLVTSVNAQQLTDHQVIDIYRRRWGIELFYRHFKQTYDRRKLRSASAPHANVEMQWSLLGLWAMALYAQVELTKQQLNPQQLSVAKTLKAFRRMARDYLHPIAKGCSLNHLLHRALRDTYQRRNKASRDYPRKKKADPPAGAPEISRATPAQIQRARELKRDLQKGLTA